MAIELNEQVFTIERTLTGSDSFIVNTGDNLEIKNGNLTILKAKPVAGKKWRVVINVHIEESKT